MKYMLTIIGEEGGWEDVTPEDMRPIDMIVAEGAADTSGVPVRAEHEVPDDQLAPALEKIGERFLPVHRVEDIFLHHLDPGKLTPLGVHLIAMPGQLLLLGEERFPLGDPLFLRNDSRGLHVTLLVLESGWLDDQPFNGIRISVRPLDVFGSKSLP